MNLVCWSVPLWLVMVRGSARGETGRFLARRAVGQRRACAPWSHRVRRGRSPMSGASLPAMEAGVGMLLWQCRDIRLMPRERLGNAGRLRPTFRPAIPWLYPIRYSKLHRYSSSDPQSARRCALADDHVLDENFGVPRTGHKLECAGNVVRNAGG
jgi:hypothetical protein